MPQIFDQIMFYLTFWSVVDALIVLTQWICACVSPRADCNMVIIACNLHTLWMWQNIELDPVMDPIKCRSDSKNIKILVNLHHWGQLVYMAWIFGPSFSWHILFYSFIDWFIWPWFLNAVNRCSKIMCSISFIVCVKHSIFLGHGLR